MKDTLLLEIIGLIGITLIISIGKIFAPLRDWLLGFEYRANPLRMFGELINCSMCSGFWVGFIWALVVRNASIPESIVFGGFISVVSFLGQAIAMVIPEKKAKKSPVTLEKLAAAREHQRAERLGQMQRRRKTSRALTEEEANEIADRMNEQEVEDLLGVGGYGGKVG